jgi:hypothetical protein
VLYKAIFSRLLRHAYEVSCRAGDEEVSPLKSASPLLIGSPVMTNNENHPRRIQNFQHFLIYTPKQSFGNSLMYFFKRPEIADIA